MTQRISNSNARYWVSDKLAFKGSQLHARWIGQLYVVFSHGEHCPIYIFDKHSDQWFENATWVSVAIANHIKQARPRVAATPLPTTKVPVTNMRSMIDNALNSQAHASRTDSSAGVSST